MTVPPNADYGAEHAALWAELRDVIQRSITAAGAPGMTVTSPSAAASYAANALFEHEYGNALLRQLVAHINAPPNDGSRAP